jgi:lysophospholipase L1-like esterase
VTNYGSGIYPGPTTSSIQDAGWADPDLKWGMLGDSITYRSAPKLRAAFAQAGVDSFAIRAHSGQNWAGSNTWLDSLTYLPDNLIVFLGANDVQNPFGVPEQIARTKSIIGEGVNLFLVDTYVNRPAYPNHDLRNSGQVNGYIRQAVDAAHTVNWVAAITSAVGRGIQPGYSIQDGVHPWVAAENGHGDGTAFLAATVIQAIQPFLV